MELEKVKKRRTVEDVFQEINRNYVKIKHKDRRVNNAVLYTVLREIVRIMQHGDQLFSSMKPRLDYLGSYYDGLRVGLPNEYDINVILKLPVNYKKIVLDARKTCFDYTHIVMPAEFRRLATNQATIDKGFDKTKMWCDSQYRLSVGMFRSWMQSVVDAALATLPPATGSRRVLRVGKKNYLISAKISGPANTITIIAGNKPSNVIDVDLVPTFLFTLPAKPIGSQVRFEDIQSTKIKQYFVVPKPSDDDFSWRLTFPFQEKHYMKNKNNLKGAVKLIKLLRDVQNFKQLVSYFIKTIFLWEIKYKSDDSFWKNNSLSYLVIYMLKRLRDCLSRGEIKNIWCPEHNLLEGKIKIDTCSIWSKRVSSIVNTLINAEKSSVYSPQVIFDYFTSKP